MKTQVLDIKGKKAGDIDLSDAVFGIEPNAHAIYLDVKQHLANRRQGTHKSKERAEITGSTKKIKKQKGTGTARAGDIKSPIFRGGGTVFGPRPRDYSFKLNKKQKKLARRSALSQKLTDEGLKVVKDLELKAPKTKDFIAILKNLKSDDKKVLLVLDETNKNVYLSARNLEGVKVVTASQVNTYDLVNCTNVLLTEKSVSQIEQILS